MVEQDKGLVDRATNLNLYKEAKALSEISALFGPEFAQSPFELYDTLLYFEDKKAEKYDCGLARKGSLLSKTSGQ